MRVQVGHISIHCVLLSTGTINHPFHHPHHAGWGIAGDHGRRSGVEFVLLLLLLSLLLLLARSLVDENYCPQFARRSLARWAGLAGAHSKHDLSPHPRRARKAPPDILLASNRLWRWCWATYSWFPFDLACSPLFVSLSLSCRFFLFSTLPSVTLAVLHTARHILTRDTRLLL